MLHDLIRQNRSYRRFDEAQKITADTLRELVDLARLSPSSANIQPLKYYLACDPHANDVIFRHLSWAGYLKDWPGPAEGERPTAYIVILGDRQLARSFRVDQGIAAQSIMLGAAEKGLGGCIMGSVNRVGLQRDLSLPDSFEILLVVALGKPSEAVRLETMGPDGSIRYWRSEDGMHHVPKRKLEDIILDPYVMKQK
ncbi:MAG: nitroreductase family protein [Acidobacteria bacterium]|nr:nitroreductase family protein [Acidobacteriota bacterium]